MKVFWSNEALQDREDIWDYIAKDNSIAAAEMDELFSKAASLLSDQPFLGKAGKVHGTREFIVSFDHIQRIMLYKGHGLWERF